MTVRLEHANLCVRDIDEMIRFLQTSFPAFRIRRDAIDLAAHAGYMLAQMIRTSP